MAGSIYGKRFRISTWGESHGKGVGVVIDGCPAGLELSEEDIQAYLDRRKPGQSKYATPRKEDDKVEILSGVFEGKTTGTIRNVRRITVRSLLTIDRGMRILPLMKSLDFGIIAAADVHLRGRRSRA